MTFEVVMRWGDELLDVQYVDDRCRIGDVDIALVDGARGTIGHVDYAIAKTTLAPRSVPYARGDDRRVVPYLGVALVAHLAVWGVATQDEPTSPVVARTPRPLHLARSFANAQAAPPESCDRDDSRDTKEAGTHTPMLLPGSAGSPDATRDRGHIAIERTRVAPQLANNAALEAARDAGVLGSTAVTDTDAFRALMGSADLASGFDGASIDSTLIGGEGAARGNTGLGFAGDTGGIVGAGRYDTSFGTGTGTGDGWGGDTGPELPSLRVDIEICGNPFANTCVQFGEVDERVIRRRVLRHYDKLAGCWRSRLYAGIGGGPLIVDFTIARSGRVMETSASGIDPAVDACVARVYRKIRFARMKTGVQIRHVLAFTRSSIQ